MPRTSTAGLGVHVLTTATAVPARRFVGGVDSTRMRDWHLALAAGHARQDLSCYRGAAPVAALEARAAPRTSEHTPRPGAPVRAGDTSLPITARWDGMFFRVMLRRNGPTVCLAPAGELDLGSGSALDELYIGADEATVVACDSRNLAVMDHTGLDGLIAFFGRLDVCGIAFFAYDWQPQPRRLLDLIDAMYPPTGTKGIRGGPTGLLRRSLLSAVRLNVRTRLSALLSTSTPAELRSTPPRRPRGPGSATPPGAAGTAPGDG